MARLIASDFDFNSVARILNLPDGTLPQHPATVAQLNSAIEGLAPKDSCRVSTQGNINLASPGATIDGITMVAGDRILVRSQTAPAENGIYNYNGAATPATRSLDANTANELEAAVTTVEEGTDAGTTWRQTSVNFTLGTGAVNWVSFGTAAPSASTSVAGLIAIATQAEVDAGVVPNKTVTPATLVAFSGRKLKAIANIGDGTATQYDITHNFNTRDLTVEVYRNATPWDSVICDISRPTVNAVRLNFAAAPTSNQFSVVIVG